MSKDIKRMVAEIRGALDQYPREQLQEILAWVFKEYVVESGAAPAQGALAMLDARTELEGLSFAELMTWLQLHLDVPELAAFEVDGARVSLRSGARSIPVEVARQPEPQPVAPPDAAPPVAASPASPVAAPAAAPPLTAPAAPPAQPTPSQAAPSQAAPQPPGPAAPSTEPAKPDEKKDDSPSSRCSWLEVD